MQQFYNDILCLWKHHMKQNRSCQAIRTHIARSGKIQWRKKKKIFVIQWPACTLVVACNSTLRVWRLKSSVWRRNHVLNETGDNTQPLLSRELQLYLLLHVSTDQKPTFVRSVRLCASVCLSVCLSVYVPVVGINQCQWCRDYDQHLNNVMRTLSVFFVIFYLESHSFSK